jgi:hypothetical protein
VDAGLHVHPTSLAIDVSGNQLIGDNGSLRQVHTYTALASPKPTLAKSLGPEAVMISS